MTNAQRKPRKKILLCGPSLMDVRDGVIMRGFLNLLNEAVDCDYDEYELHCFFINDHESQSIEAMPCGVHFVFIIGTPWLWDKAFSSHKWKNLSVLLQMNSDAKIFFAGIGACFCLNCDKEKNTDMVGKYIFEEATSSNRQDTVIITRDKIADEILSDWKYDTLTKAHVLHLLCPSYFAQNRVDFVERQNIKIEKTSLIVQGLSVLISQTCFSEDEKKAYWDKMQMHVLNAEKNGRQVDVYYCLRKEKEEVRQHFPDAQLIHSLEHAYFTYCQSKTVITSRVHCAIPAQVLGCEVLLEPLDSRYLTFHPDFFKRGDWLWNKYEWVRVLKRFVEGVEVKEEKGGEK